MKKFLLPVCLTLCSLPAMAEPFTYGPEPCEFQVTFPEKPLIEKKCSGVGIDNCTEVVSFTKTAGVNSSTYFRVTCTSIKGDEVSKYTPAIIEETLRQLLKSNNLEAYDIQSAETDGYKNASAISLSVRDDKSLIYNAQMWLGKKSMLTLEAEMAGDQNDAIEKTFADILKNSYPKDRPPTPASNPAPDAPKEKPSE
jgi:hypothetical protein